MIVGHGHFARVLLCRWLDFPLKLGRLPILPSFTLQMTYTGAHFNVEPGGVTVLGYNHNSLEEPALNALNLHATVV
jgi:hypothetical protein